MSTFLDKLNLNREKKYKLVEDSTKTDKTVELVESGKKVITHKSVTTIIEKFYETDEYTLLYEFIRKNKIIIAGGSVLEYINENRYSCSSQLIKLLNVVITHPSSHNQDVIDYDIYFPSEKEFTEFTKFFQGVLGYRLDTREICKDFSDTRYIHISEEYRRNDRNRTNSDDESYTFCDIKCVYKMYTNSGAKIDAIICGKSPIEILLQFDFINCMSFFDGNNFYTPIENYKDKKLYVNKKYKGELKKKRLTKYINRGYRLQDEKISITIDNFTVIPEMSNVLNECE